MDPQVPLPPIRRPRRAQVVSLGLSVCVHGLAALLLGRAALRQPPAPIPPAADSAVEIALVEAPVPSEPVAPGAAPPSRAVEDRPAPARDDDRRSRAAGVASALDRRKPPLPSPDSPPASRALPRPPVTLALDLATVDRLTRRGVLGPGEAVAAPAPAPRSPTFRDRLAALERQDGARRNVARGKVHPQVFDYMRDARKVFAPDPGVVDLDPRTPNDVKNSLRQWGGGLKEAYRSWRRDVDELRDRTRAADDFDRRRHPDILEHYNRILEGNQRAAEGIVAHACLLVASGATPAVELGQSSGNAEVDRAAIDALTRAARRRPADHDLARQRTCYSFSVKVVRVPPLPVAGCMFDEVELTASCFYPLKKGMTLSVSLDSVDYDPPP